MDSKMAGFEAAMSELEMILEKMSGDEMTLEESVSSYARAAGLIQDCNEALREAKVQLEEIDTKFEGFLSGEDE